MRLYLIIACIIILLSSCNTEKKVEQRKVEINDLYSYCSCYEHIFKKFEFQINKNTYIYINECGFCQESNYKFTKRDFDALGVGFNRATEILLNKFYKYTGVNEKYIYKIIRDDFGIIIFGGSPVGASGKYSDYLEWLILEIKSGEVLKNTQTSLSKYPFVFYIDDNKKINFIDYDYDRGNNGYINVRNGEIPITLHLSTYILNEGKFNNMGNEEYQFYCRDSSFYANDIIW